MCCVTGCNCITARRPAAPSCRPCSPRSALAPRAATISISRWGGASCAAMVQASIGTIKSFPDFTAGAATSRDQCRLTHTFMALYVHKYGGTSMGSTERIRNVARRVAKWVRAGHQVVVVPSAMSGETNRLLGLAKEIWPGKASDAYHRELDQLAATGEQASSALLAIALQGEGLAAVSFAGW